MKTCSPQPQQAEHHEDNQEHDLEHGDHGALPSLEEHHGTRVGPTAMQR
jgi:hypothetical protein